MTKKKGKEKIPIISLDEDEREEMWDDIFIKEEGIILTFNAASNTGKIKSLADGGIYEIDHRGLIRTKIELRSGDKVLFAPFKDPKGKDYARVIRILGLHA